MHAVERSDPPDFLRHFTTSCDAQLAVQRACAYLPAGCLPDRLSNFGVDEEGERDAAMHLCMPAVHLPASRLPARPAEQLWGRRGR
eukprot:357300-Chlamydomonas_euryale.AAC.4